MEKRRDKSTNPVGRLSTKLINILSLLPPSDARPACISTSMASATCLSFTIGVPHLSSNSFSIAMARLHFRELIMRWRTTSAAVAQTAAAQTTAAPTATFPITALKQQIRIPQSWKLCPLMGERETQIRLDFNFNGEVRDDSYYCYWCTLVEKVTVAWRWGLGKRGEMKWDRQTQQIQEISKKIYFRSVYVGFKLKFT